MFLWVGAENDGCNQERQRSFSRNRNDNFDTLAKTTKTAESPPPVYYSLGGGNSQLYGSVSSGITSTKIICSTSHWRENPHAVYYFSSESNSQLCEYKKTYAYVENENKTRNRIWDTPFSQRGRKSWRAKNSPSTQDLNEVTSCLLPQSEIKHETNALFRCVCGVRLAILVLSDLLSVMTSWLEIWLVEQIIIAADILL